MIPGHKRVRCEASGRAQQSFGQANMPQDDTWQPNRHHSNIFPLFRNHLTRNAVAMFPPPLNPVASTEHEFRDPHLPDVPHTENAEEERGRVVLGLPELSHVYSTHHDDSSCATESQDAVTEAAGSGSQRQDPGEGMSSPIGQALGKWYREGKYVASCVEPSSTTRAKSREPASPIQRKLVSDEEKRHSSQKVEGRTELDLVQDEVDEAKRLLEEAHVEVQAAQNKVTEAAFRVGQAMEEMAQIGKLLAVNPEPTDQ